MGICARTRACARITPATRRSFVLALQQFAQRTRGGAAVAAPILLRRIKFRHRFVEFGQPEISVIAEAAGASRSFENDTLPDAVRGERRRIGRLDEYQRASIARPTLRGRQS